jgi:hypothetical protein
LLEVGIESGSSTDIRNVGNVFHLYKVPSFKGRMRMFTNVMKFGFVEMQFGLNMPMNPFILGAVNKLFLFNESSKCLNIPLYNCFRGMAVLFSHIKLQETLFELR